jgi:hypothetical protein
MERVVMMARLPAVRVRLLLSGVRVLVGRIPLGNRKKRMTRRRRKIQRMNQRRSIQLLIPLEGRPLGMKKKTIAL